MFCPHPRFRDLGAAFSSFGCFVFEIWVLRTSVFVFEYFVFETTFHFGHMHIRSLNNTSFIYVLVKVLTLIARFFPVNPFVDETDSSFEKKKDLHAHQTSFRQKRMAKNKLTETTHSLSSATCVPGS